jgi:hypothetical protein
MLTMGQMIKAATKRWKGLRDRAAKVSVSGVKSGFRSNWKVPDTSYWVAPGVQEVTFVTLASDSVTDRRFRKPYTTIFRFPLNPATGEPYPAGTGTSDLPVWVHCSCPAFQYYCEVAVKNGDSTDQISSDGSFPKQNNPSMEPIICKHLLATANSAMQKRKSMGVTASVDSLQDDPAEPKDRDPEATARAPRPAGRKTPRNALTASSPQSLPQTWLGRLAYILFNERTR